MNANQETMSAFSNLFLGKGAFPDYERYVSIKRKAKKGILWILLGMAIALSGLCLIEMDTSESIVSGSFILLLSAVCFWKSEKVQQRK